MAAFFNYTELDALQKYRDSVYKHREDIIKCLRTGFWRVPLISVGCLDEDEWGAIEDQSGSGRDKRTNRATAILDIVIKKDSFICYNGFSRVLADKDRRVAGQIFPFINELEGGGLHEPIVPPKHITEWTKSTKVDILWILSYGSGYDEAIKLMTPKGSEKMDRFFYGQELICEGSATLFIAYPKTSYTGCNCYSSLLNNLRPRLAVMTGQCHPLRGNTTLTPGEIVMQTTRESLTITGEVGFMCELWKLRKEIMTPVVVGRATKWAEYDSCLVQCRDAVDFYNAARKVDNLEYFALLQVGGGQSSSASSSAADLLKLMHKIISYFSDDRI